MKLQISNNQGSDIEGFVNISVDSLDNEFQQIPDNSCEFILAKNIVDYISFQEIEQTLLKLLSKLRLNGSLVVGGKDLNLFCKHVRNDLLSQADACTAIEKCRSMVSYKTIENIFKKMNLKYTTQLVGINYEVTVSR